MTKSDDILAALKRSGERMTLARRSVVRVIAEASGPLTVTEMLKLLKASRILVNKTTVYREVKFLESKDIVRSIQFDERNRRYEIVPVDHRHHLICTNCRKIEDVVLHHDLDHVEAALTKEKRFKVERHALEFYGVCGECQ